MRQTEKLLQSTRKNKDFLPLFPSSHPKECVLLQYLLNIDSQIDILSGSKFPVLVVLLKFIDHIQH